MFSTFLFLRQLQLNMFFIQEMLLVIKSDYSAHKQQGRGQYRKIAEENSSWVLKIAVSDIQPHLLQ